MIERIGANLNLTQRQGTTTNNKGFGYYLQNALKEVNRLEKEADNLTKKLAAGENVDLHDVMIATEKANIALQLTVQVRNKAVEAYNEIMRMQV
ncbi:flagellar hook-basal body complex protein FliE [Anaerobranca californiensis DSM 14826]|jgi:flagellar hook-basal body complex protein FliE|uniref:Flagellar hook-basal body complex protein FliE n=1 Tax=Anaerobranca californiensis DSM 14826 TaxID=1120989 RepID=A0A1M6KJH7_9FIRM|nr:flagellar hook-basal body complex protein FliE [Anaerobranca californiensis]SHJ59132.1 flagellar hook-basal body complex protein FliE [Anaerobranca californiensis DSM 14826]